MHNTPSLPSMVTVVEMQSQFEAMTRMTRSNGVASR